MVIGSAIYFLIGIVGLAINHMGLLELSEEAHLPRALFKIDAAGFVFTFNFIARKTVLFRVAAPRG